MENKTLKLMTAGIFAVFLLVLCTGAASAAITLDKSSLTFKHVDNINQLTISNSDSFLVNVSLPEQLSGTHGEDVATLTYYTSESDANSSINPITSVSVSATGSTIVYIKATPNKYFFLGGTGTVSDSANSSNSASFSVDFKGSLTVTIDDLSVEEGFGPEDNEWYPLDKITAKILVENDNTDGSDEKIKNIVVQWGLYDKTSGKWIVGINKESKFSIDGGDDKTLTLTFDIEKLSRLKDSDGNSFVFYAWATGNDYAISDEHPETSSSVSEEIMIDIDDDFVVLNNIQLDQSVACGGQLHILADVVNIGIEDEDDVYVVIYNKDLKINQKVEIGDLNSMETTSLDTTVTIPKDAAEKTYVLTFYVYNEDDELFQNDNDDDAKFQEIFTVENCVVTPKLSIAASLESGGKAGESLTVKATITNTGDNAATYNLNIAGYAEWASSANTDKNVLTLNAGQSQDVQITFDVKRDVEGTKKFDIEVLSENELVMTQPVSVLIEKQPGFFGITGDIISEGNAWLWGIGALNLLLVLIIIIVAIKIIRK